VWLRSGVPVATAGFAAAREVRAIKSLIEAGAPVAASVVADPTTDLKQVGREVLTPAPRARAI
jgi:Reductase C-terminal